MAGGLVAAQLYEETSVSPHATRVSSPNGSGISQGEQSKEERAKGKVRRKRTSFSILLRPFNILL